MTVNKIWEFENIRLLSIQYILIFLFVSIQQNVE